MLDSWREHSIEREQIKNKDSGAVFLPVNNLRCRSSERLPAASAAGASMIREFLQCRAKTQAAVSDQSGAEYLGPVVGKRPGKPAADFLAGE
jgi:hypothetical protein